MDFGIGAVISASGYGRPEESSLLLAAAFGDQQPERVVRNNRLQSGSELSRNVLSEL